LIKISVMIEGQQGLTWSYWKSFIREVEDTGFAGVFCSDHFVRSAPPDKASLELIVSLTYVASHTRNIRFGSLVAPVSFRDPVILARQAIALAELSNARFILGVGAGWQEREHTMFGYPLGSINSRMSRFEEGIEVLDSLLRKGGPVTYKGKYFQLTNATVFPHAQPKQTLPLLIGGNGLKRTLPLVAKYATIWNAQNLSPDAFRQRSAILDSLLHAVGRNPDEVQRTMTTGIIYAHNTRDLNKLLKRKREEFPIFQSNNDFFNFLRSQSILVGTSDMLRRQFLELEAAGVEEVMLQWTDFENIDSLRSLAGILKEVKDE
jgi:alkanesulfonate monooxygenase SsuD/methylene tetrahydromethanopterin reductase-like flavin-dependent oxidoreductase (luciferase family)